jgi:hypothetical protein
MSTFFKRSDSGKYARNAIFVDLEPSVISEIRYGEYRQLCHLFYPQLCIEEILRIPMLIL